MCTALILFNNIKPLVFIWKEESLISLIFPAIGKLCDHVT